MVCAAVVQGTYNWIALSVSVIGLAALARAGTLRDRDARQSHLSSLAIAADTESLMSDTPQSTATPALYDGSRINSDEVQALRGVSTALMQRR